MWVLKQRGKGATKTTPALTQRCEERGETERRRTLCTAIVEIVRKLRANARKAIETEKWWTKNIENPLFLSRVFLSASPAPLRLCRAANLCASALDLRSLRVIET